MFGHTVAWKKKIQDIFATSYTGCFLVYTYFYFKRFSLKSNDYNDYDRLFFYLLFIFCFFQLLNPNSLETFFKNKISTFRNQFFRWTNDINQSRSRYQCCRVCASKKFTLSAVMSNQITRSFRVPKNRKQKILKYLVRTIVILNDFQKHNVVLYDAIVIFSASDLLRYFMNTYL